MKLWLALGAGTLAAAMLAGCGVGPFAHGSLAGLGAGQAHEHRAPLGVAHVAHHPVAALAPRGTNRLPRQNASDRQQPGHIEARARFLGAPKP
ncbi:hypothetical protein, partial [uncultured Alcanivorax sp.]|uniref:hypothetical protein n=1 Tax=uncultured Alcanivorax sp. TaxID=191215 RepID=UPI002631A141